MSIIIERLRQKHRTIRYPDGEPPTLPDRWRGRPLLDQSHSAACRDIAGVCPTGALTSGDSLAIDMGKCLFCGACAAAAPDGAIRFSREFDLAAFDRDDLVVGIPQNKDDKTPGGKKHAVKPVDKKARGKTAEAPRSDGADRAARLARVRGLFKRSFRLRQVSAGGCNACEADANVLSTIAWDMGRFGIQFVASPRHADGILVTGPVTANMRLALEKTYVAVPEPKVVIAVGACAIAGGIYANEPNLGGVDRLMPVDLYIPGCPPHPLVILDGLLRLLGRV